MRRHVCHELAHVFAAERTGSVKRLGDGDRGMRMRPWLDEGFAECVAALAADRADIIDAARIRSEGVTMTDDELDAAFRDLGSPRRSVAFALATVRVWNTVTALGLAHAFGALAAPHL